MKLPQVALVACFAGGIAIGLYSSFGRLATSLLCFAALIAALLLVTIALLFRRRGATIGTHRPCGKPSR